MEKDIEARMKEAQAKAVHHRDEAERCLRRFAESEQEGYAEAALAHTLLALSYVPRVTLIDHPAPSGLD